MAKPFKPGQIVQRSGLYDAIGPRGGDTGKQITAVKGKTFPPQKKDGMTYKLVDPAKHKRH